MSAQTTKSKSLSLSPEEIHRKLLDNMDVLQGQYGVGRIGLFGSLARGEQKPGSDIDLLVEFNRPIGLFKFVELEGRLSKMLGAKVDLVTRNALKPHIGRRILEEVRYVN